LVTRVQSPQESAGLQQELVQKFSNVSAIDLNLVLQTLDTLLGKIGFVLRFMALFTVTTGIFLLIGTVLTGRFQRVQESVLLRALGAQRKQVQQILICEYLLLGLVAALAGVILALGGAWALAQFVFQIKFSVAVWPTVIGLLAVPLITVFIGWAMNRGLHRLPPLAVLRREA
jgi:putative ABC transport system permease protein